MVTKILIGTVTVFMLIISSTVQAEQQDKQLSIIFTTHASTNNQFWQTVRNGFQDACEKVHANCQMLFAQKEGSVQQEISHINSAIARNPDALLTTIPNGNAFDAIIKRARNKGIIVLAVNVDDPKGAAGNARQAFIGQSFKPAGYRLAKAMSKHFTNSPINVLIGVSFPGQTWSEQRAAGIIQFLNHYKQQHPDQNLSYTKINSGTSLAKTAQRVGAYLLSHPNIDVYFDTGYWDAAVAGVLEDRDYKPGKVLVGGFDLVPIALKKIKKGYIQVHIDQQPYMQGFIPVMEVYLMKNFGLSAFNVNTGKGLVTPENVDSVIDLAKKGLR